MKASELKNTPWEIQRDFESEKAGWLAPLYEVLSSDGTTIADMLDEPTAKAIASLPDTLKELEAVKAELKKVKDKLKVSENLKTEYFNAFSKALDKLTQAQAERDELRAFINDFNRAQKETYGNATNTHLKMIDLAKQAKKLLNTKK